MAHRMLKPYSFLLYLLAFITFFFVGLSYAGIVEAGKNQGLAGGAIVVGYGVISAVIGLIIALFVSYKASRKFIFSLNVILALCIVGFYAYFHIRFLETQKDKEQENQEIQQPKQPTAPATAPMAILVSNDAEFQAQPSFGLGMFSPNISELKPLYFYGNLNLEKSIMEHVPTDSITFKQTEYSGFDIATAPPYLVPEHLKLDYDILYFKAISVTDDFIEIEVNKLNNQTAFVSKYSGVLKYWPEFLLSINSVELLDPTTQAIYVKPLDHAGTLNHSYSFMRPLKIKQDWMYVLLLHNDLKPVGKGWIKWHEDGKLLITYSLFS